MICLWREKIVSLLYDLSLNFLYFLVLLHFFSSQKTLRFCRPLGHVSCYFINCIIDESGRGTSISVPLILSARSLILSISQSEFYFMMTFIIEDKTVKHHLERVDSLKSISIFITVAERYVVYYIDNNLLFKLCCRYTYHWWKSGWLPTIQERRERPFKKIAGCGINPCHCYGAIHSCHSC